MNKSKNSGQLFDKWLKQEGIFKQVNKNLRKKKLNENFAKKTKKRIKRK